MKSAISSCGVTLRKKFVTSVGREVISKEFAMHHKPKGPVDPHPDQDTRNLPMPLRRNQMSVKTF